MAQASQTTPLAKLGIDVLRDPVRNNGTTFTQKERERIGEQRVGEIAVERRNGSVESQVRGPGVGQECCGQEQPARFQVGPDRPDAVGVAAHLQEAK